MSQVVTVPSEVLREVAKPVDKLDKKTLNLIQDMLATLKAAKQPEGVGLAAPQIGVPLRIFLIRPKPRKKDDITIFINPEITQYSQRLQTTKDKDGVLEGCLSIPHHYSPVARSMSVTVKYWVPDVILSRVEGSLSLKEPSDSSTSVGMTMREEVFSGFPAHIIQHELDHLNGILFIDRVLEQNLPLFKVEGKKWTEISL